VALNVGSAVLIANGVTTSAAGVIEISHAIAAAPKTGPPPAAGAPTTSPSASPKVTVRYKRPSGTPTRAQRASVQGKPCVDCSKVAPTQVADHKTPLVKEHYQTGTIDLERAKSLDAVQPQCPTCSAKQGAEMSAYSKAQRKANGL
jgi:hypothetical protein